MKIIATLVALIIINGAFAQEDKYVIIDRSDYEKKKEKEIKLNDNIQVYKFAPLNMFAGEILFGYERQINKKSSFDVELGPTISKIGLGFQMHGGTAFEPDIQDVSGMGVVTGISFRYYPLDETEALNRFYVAPQFRFKVYNHGVQDVGGFLPEVQKGNQVNSNFYFNFGYQVWLSKTFSLDMYCGTGIGMRTERDYYVETVFVNNQWEYQWVELNGSGARYLFQLGLKVGIGAE